MKDKAMVAPGSAPKGNAGVLREFALGFPGAHEDFPWGERVAKVRGKVFVFLGRDEAGLGLSVKLPHSRTMALGLPFASPTAYGLGKSGWVTVEFGPREKPPLDLLRTWIEESYRAVAPKTLVKQLEGRAPAPKQQKKTKQRKTKGQKPRARTGTGTRTRTR
jgi:predicted DNA-binding protein (MmcQ/YjbR family)